VLHLKDLDCTKIVQREQLVVPWIRKGTDPMVSQRVPNPMIPKGFPNAVRSAATHVLL